jgi:hypothetical protein
MSMTRAGRVLHVTGNAEERAYQQALAFADESLPAASSICSLLVDPKWFSESVHQRLSQAGLFAAGAYFLRRNRPVLWRHAGGKYWRAQRGLARGAGLSRSFSFGLSAVPEIVGAKMGYTLGCTAVALAPEASASGGAQLLYNHDFPARFSRYLIVRRATPADGYATVVLTYPLGVGCVAGVNDQGLLVSYNHAFATDFHDGPGMLPSVLSQDCLERCATVQEAIELFETTPSTNGGIVTVADAAGERAAIELSCTQTRVRRADGPALVSFNKYGHADMEAVEVPLEAVATGVVSGLWLHETNIERQRRIDVLVDHAPAVWDQPFVESVMGDHDGAAGGNLTLCRHYDMGDTLATVILDSATRTLRVSWGHACAANYVDYGLTDRAIRRASAAA